LFNLTKDVVSGKRPSWDGVKASEACKQLIEECWHETPSKRPAFAQIVVRLESCFFEAVIPSESARRFWRESFVSAFGDEGNQIMIPAEEVPWEEFEQAVRRKFFTRALELYPNDLEFDVRIELLRKLLEKDGTVTVTAWGQTCEWFGPFSDSASHLLLENVYNILRHPWFFGAVSADDARRSIGSSTNFLIRFSSSTFGAYVLSRGQKVKVDKKTVYKPVHQTITKTPDGFLFVKSGSRATSLVDLVAILKKELGLKKEAPGSSFGPGFLTHIKSSLSSGRAKEPEYDDQVVS
jgi:SH2 domain